MMYQITPGPLLRTVLPVLLCGLLSGCFGSGTKEAVHYYLIDPVASEAPEGNTGKAPAIEIIDLHVSQYLDRFQIVTRNGENRLHLSETNQWGENLRKNLMHVLAINLSDRLSSIDISTPLNRSVSLPDYRLQVYIGQFELGRNGKVRLSARWQLSNVDEQELGMHAVSLQSEEQVDRTNYDKIISDMQDLFAGLCDRISASIMELEEPR